MLAARGARRACQSSEDVCCAQVCDNGAKREQGVLRIGEVTGPRSVWVSSRVVDGMERHRGGRRGRRGSAMTDSRRGWSCVPTVSHSRLSCESAQLRNLSVRRTTSLAGRWRVSRQDGLVLAHLHSCTSAEVQNRGGARESLPFRCSRSSSNLRLQTSPQAMPMTVSSLPRTTAVPWGGKFRRMS